MRKKVFILANALYKKSEGIITKSDCFKAAWKTIRTEETTLIEFFKESAGEIVKRIVNLNYKEFYTPKGTGRPKPEHLLLYADYSKVLLGEPNVLGSAKKNNILNLI